MNVQKNKKVDIEIVYWSDVCDHVRKIAPDLFGCIEFLGSETKNLPLLKAKYPFGTNIVYNGVVNLPCGNGEVLSIDDPDLDDKIKRKLSYSAIPAGLLLNKASEVFVQDSDYRVIPLILLRPGKVFGVFETVDSLLGYRFSPIWCVSSGARSIFFLPKVSEATSFNKLKKKFGLKSSAPKGFADQWGVFVELVQNYYRDIEDDSKKWNSEVLYFTDSWFKNDSKNLAWLRFYNYFQKEAWLNSQASREDTAFGLLWLKFSSIMARRNFRPRPYIMDTVRHLINISRGTIPGFRPAVSGDDIIAPVKIIEEAYIHVYGLKKHFPTLMHPDGFFEGNINGLYYSLAMPTVLDSYSKERNPPTIINDLRDIKTFVDIFTVSVCKNMHNIGRSSVENIACFDYFHVGNDVYGEIKRSSLIPQEDRSFVDRLVNYPNLSFCATSPFWFGAIKVYIENSR